MRFSDKITGILSLDLEGKCEESILNRIIFINLICLAGVLMLAVFSAIAFITGDQIRGIMAASVALIISGGFYYVRKTLRYSFIAVLNTILLLMLLFFLLFFEPNAESYLFWLLVIPVISIPVFGQKKGIIISLSVLAITLLIYPTYLSRDIPGEYGFIHIARFAGSYAGLLIISFAIEYFRSNSLRLIEIRLLEAKNEVKSREAFISRLSHQIRTPLNDIMLIGNMVNESNLTEAQKDLMETIMASAYNLLNAVENITELTSDNLKDKHAEKISFNMYNTVSSTIKLFSHKERSDIEFNFAISKNLKNNRLVGDPVLVKQIIINLIETIIKYKVPDSLSIGIEIDTTYDTDDYADVRFIVSTDRPVSLPVGLTGLSDSQLVFPAGDFSGYINTSEMAIAHKLVSQNGGNLEISFSPGNNLVFDFSLPFHKSFKDKKVEHPAPAPAVKSIIPPRRVELKDASVLLVEDNSINQKILLLSLNKEVKKIDVADNGKEAVDKFGKSKYDIILMDIQMPIMDGIVATRKIREVESSIHSRTPIIAITANALHGDRETCLSAGMDDYISKPFNAEDLLLKMKKLLQRS